MTLNYDIFITAKNLGSDGKRTEDSLIADKLHIFLTDKGFHVFSSNISLENLGVASYKEVIENALDSSKILIVVGTSKENIESKWVKYEWDSFFNDILSGIKPDGKVFAYIKNVKIGDLPRPIRITQCVEHGPEGFEKLYEVIEAYLGQRFSPEILNKETAIKTKIRVDFEKEPVQSQNDLNRVINLLKEQETICRKIGNKDGLQQSLGNQGLILADLDEFDISLNLLQEQEAICREIGNINDLQKCLGNQAHVLKARYDMQIARPEKKPPETSTLESGYIFISYKQEDFSKIVSFMHHIVDWGYPIWYDKGIPGGAEWDTLIEEKVSGCKFLLVFLSSQAINSKWVQREIKFADHENRPILGVRLDTEIKLKHGLNLYMSPSQMIDIKDANFLDQLHQSIEYNFSLNLRENIL